MKTSQFLAALFTTLIASTLHAQTAVPDILKQMSGCFRVTFNYIEDGDHDAFYEPVLERADVTSESPLTLTRHLIIGGQEQLHWSDQWTQVEDRKWHQQVTGPFGDFRYACDGVWTLNQWRCLAERVAKPRRDQARPYEYLDRENTLQVNGKRWVHSQSNRKITDSGELFSVETGWNTYERVEDQLCKVNSNSSWPKHITQGRNNEFL